MVLLFAVAIGIAYFMTRKHPGIGWAVSAYIVSFISTMAGGVGLYLLAVAMKSSNGMFEPSDKTFGIAILAGLIGPAIGLSTARSYRGKNASQLAPATTSTDGNQPLCRMDARGPMDFFQAVSSGITKYIDGRGRASRSEFWWFYTFYTVVFAICTLTGKEIPIGNWQVLVALLIICATLFPPMVATTVRRLHDIDRSGWWSLLCIIPLVGWCFVLVWGCARGTAGSNRFGADPLGDVQPSNGAEPLKAATRQPTAAVPAPGPRIADNEIYALVAAEMESGTVDKGLWTRLFAEHDGEESKTKAAYIRERVSAVQAERDDEARRATDAKRKAEKAAASRKTDVIAQTVDKALRAAEAEFENEAAALAKKLGISPGWAAEAIIFGIVCLADGTFVYGDYNYDKIADAIEYANKVAAREARKSKLIWKYAERHGATAEDLATAAAAGAKQGQMLLLTKEGTATLHSFGGKFYLDETDGKFGNVGRLLLSYEIPESDLVRAANNVSYRRKRIVEWGDGRFSVGYTGGMCGNIYAAKRIIDEAASAEVG